MSETKKRSGPEPIYLLDGGDTFQGTLQQFQDKFNVEAKESAVIDWVKENKHKLQKKFKRSRHPVTVTLYDPQKPETMKFGRISWGRNTGKKASHLYYTDPEGRKYLIWLNFGRDSQIDQKAPLCHKKEIQQRILNALVKLYNGEEEPD